MAHTESVFDRSRLPTLDGLRFLALTQVVLYHANLPGVPGDGVTFFFVLSGFLFAWLLEREFGRTGTVSLRRFYWRRAVRILPACYVAIVVTILGMQWLGLAVDYRHALSAALFSANYYNAFHDHPPTGFSSYWSLAVEEQFYLVWPLLFLWLRRRSRRALLLFLSVSIVAVSGWRSWLYLHDHVGTAYIYNAFETRFDCLAVGCLAGLLAGMERVRGWIRFCCRSAFAPLVVVTILLGFEHLGDAWHFSAGLTIDSILMAVMLLQMIQLGEHPLWSWLDSRPLAWLGTLTYSGYLYHHWGLSAGHYLPWNSPVPEALAGLAATMLLAAASYFVVERPFLALKSRMAQSRRAGTPETSLAGPIAEDRRPAESAPRESAGATIAVH